MSSGIASRVVRAVLLTVLLGCPAGCGAPQSLELSGDEARQRLPREVLALVPSDVILCHDEQKEEGAYHLWILRKPGGKWMTFPKTKGLEHHSMPTSALESILESKVPSLERGQPVERRCVYTHWPTADGAEIQIREIITDQGWFASLERVHL